jgi:hypothetical protein
VAALLLSALLAGCASAPPSGTLLALPSLGAPDGAPPQRVERRYVLQAGADTPQAHAAVLGELLQRVAADVAPLATVAPAAPSPSPGASTPVR